MLVKPRIDEMLMIEPPARIAPMACLVPRKTPSTLTDMLLRQLSSVTSGSGSMMPTPALFTSTSRPPKRSTMAGIAASQSASWVTSRATNIVSAPPAESSAASASPPSRSISASATGAPSAASARAQALPMPFAAPVTSATRPSSRPAILCSPAGQSPTEAAPSIIAWIMAGFGTLGLG